MSQSNTLLYEDDGLTDAYETKGQYATTKLGYRLQSSGRAVVVEVQAANGTYSGMPTARDALTIEVLGPHVPPKRVQYTVGGATKDVVYEYDGNRLCTSVVLRGVPVASALRVVFTYPEAVGSDAQNDVVRCIARAEKAKEALDQQWGRGVYPEDYYCLLDAAETGDRISAEPANSTAEIRALHALVDESVSTLSKYSVLDDSVRKRVVALLGTC